MNGKWDPPIPSKPSSNNIEFNDLIDYGLAVMNQLIETGSVPAVFQSILPGSILPDSVASNGSRVRFTWSNQRLNLSSNDFEMDTAGFIPSGSSSPLLRPHLQPLLEDLQ